MLRTERLSTGQWQCLIPSQRPARLPDPSGQSSQSTAAAAAPATQAMAFRSIFFVSPLSSIPDMSDFNSQTSSPSLFRQPSLVSSHHSRTVDDTVILNHEYVYPGDSRAITLTRRPVARGREDCRRLLVLRPSGVENWIDCDSASHVSQSQVTPSTFTSSFHLSSDGSFRDDDSDISFANPPSILSRARDG